MPTFVIISGRRESRADMCHRQVIVGKCGIESI